MQRRCQDDKHQTSLFALLWWVMLALAGCATTRDNRKRAQIPKPSRELHVDTVGKLAETHV